MRAGRAIHNIGVLYYDRFSIRNRKLVHEYSANNSICMGKKPPFRLPDAPILAIYMCVYISYTASTRIQGAHAHARKRTHHRCMF